MINDISKELASGLGIAIAMEARRLSEKYQKDFFDCEDLMAIMGIGRNNVRELMRSASFPTIVVGNRKIVSTINFVIWQVSLCPDVNEVLKKHFDMA